MKADVMIIVNGEIVMRKIVHWGNCNEDCSWGNCNENCSWGNFI